VERGFADCGEVGENWPFVLAAGGRDGEDALDEAGAGLAAGALRPASPEHPLADPALRRIVRGFDVDVMREGPEGVPVLQQVAAHPAPALGFQLRRPLEQQPLEPGLQRRERAQEVLFRQAPRPSGVPEIEQQLHLPLRPVAQSAGPAAEFGQPDEVALQVRPANLTYRQSQLGVGRPAVRDQDASVVGTEHLLDDLGPAAIRDPEHRPRGRHHDPEPHPLAGLLPARLVGMGDRGPAGFLLRLLDGHLQPVAGPLATVLHGGHGEPGAEQVADHPDDLATAEPEHADEPGHHRLQPGAVAGAGHSRRQCGQGGRTATRAPHPLLAVLGHLRTDRRQLGDLVAHWLTDGRLAAVEDVAAALAVVWTQGLQRGQLRLGDELPEGRLVSLLATGLAAARLLLWRVLPLLPGRVGRRGLRGVAGAQPEAGLQFLEASFELTISSFQLGDPGQRSRQIGDCRRRRLGGRADGGERCVHTVSGSRPGDPVDPRITERCGGAGRIIVSEVAGAGEARQGSRAGAFTRRGAGDRHPVNGYSGQTVALGCPEVLSRHPPRPFGPGSRLETVPGPAWDAAEGLGRVLAQDGIPAGPQAAVVW